MLVSYDKGYQNKGFAAICGIDEAGRGPLAGPVVVAGVIMPLDDDKIIAGVNDSKKLSEKKREKLFDQIVATAVAYHVEVVDNVVIDEINILNATKLAMNNCIKALNSADVVLIDAVKPSDDKRIVPIIKGDATSYNIAAASILAKVTRDRLMLEMDKQYPEYCFAKHKGYGTALHIGLLKQYGPSPIHRKTFIKNFFPNE